MNDDDDGDGSRDSSPPNGSALNVSEEFSVTDNEAAEVLYSVLHSPSISRTASCAAYREPIASIYSPDNGESHQSLSSPVMETWHNSYGRIMDSSSGLSNMKQQLVIDTDGSISAVHSDTFHSPRQHSKFNSSSELNLEMTRSPIQSLLDLASMCEKR